MEFSVNIFIKIKNKILNYKLFLPHRGDICELYHISISHRIFLIITDIAALFLISLIFYNSLIPGLVAIPFIVVFYDYHYKQAVRKRKIQLEHQFRDLLTSLNAALSTGYSLENATKDAYTELISAYGEKSYICREISVIINLLNLGKPVEDAYEIFAKRCDLDCITTFSEILTISKRSSGDISAIIRATSSNLLMKIDSDRDIRSSIASKLFERNIMIFMPLIIITYVSISSPGFFTPLYETMAGRLIMTASLALYIFAIWLSAKIFNLDYAKR